MIDERTIIHELKLPKQVSIIAISAAIYTIFFFLSGLVTVPNFTILYLPIVLLRSLSDLVWTGVD